MSHFVVVDEVTWQTPAVRQQFHGDDLVVVSASVCKLSQVLLHQLPHVLVISETGNTKNTSLLRSTSYACSRHSPSFKRSVTFRDFIVLNETPVLARCHGAVTKVGAQSSLANRLQIPEIITATNEKIDQTPLSLLQTLATTRTCLPILRTLTSEAVQTADRC